MEDIISCLSSGRVLVADGATGTILQSMGLEPGIAPELWNVEMPDAVRACHRAYLEAGAQILLTNTFGGNRLKLERMGGLGDHVAGLNRAAAELARVEMGTQAYIAGDIGPTGDLMAPYGLLGYDEAVSVFAEQAKALTEGGVDLIWVETMSDLNEAAAALEGAAQVTDLPVFCAMSFTRAGRTMMGVSPTQALERLLPMGAAGIGANCGEGMEPAVAALAEMRSALDEISDSSSFLIAKPNAGLPHLEQGETVFDLGPAEMAAYVAQFLELGVQIIGGCCGSTPAHIAAIAARVAEQAEKLE